MLADGGGGEGVRLDDVRPGLQILAVNLPDDLGLGQLQQFVVPLEILARPAGETFPPKRGFIQFVSLDDRAHRAVQHQNPLHQKSLQYGDLVVCQHGGIGIQLDIPNLPASRIVNPATLSNQHILMRRYVCICSAGLGRIGDGCRVEELAAAAPGLSRVGGAG